MKRDESRSLGLVANLELKLFYPIYFSLFELFSIVVLFIFELSSFIFWNLPEEFPNYSGLNSSSSSTLNPNYSAYLCDLDGFSYGDASLDG